MGSAIRYRCSACGNLTRFDVTATRRVQEFHHFSVGGDLVVETSDVLDERVDAVVCRWCGASGDAIESLPGESLPVESLPGEAPSADALAPPAGSS